MDNCIFCKIVSGDIPSKKVYEDDNVLAFMDINPKVDGHIVVVPKKHITDFTELDSESINNIYEAAKKITPKIMKALNVSSCSLGCNYGDSQVVKHFHLHILPNFGSNNECKDVDEVFELIQKTDF